MSFEGVDPAHGLQVIIPANPVRWTFKGRNYEVNDGLGVRFDSDSDMPWFQFTRLPLTAVCNSCASRPVSNFVNSVVVIISSRVPTGSLL